ncbi:deoxynucleoside kinase|uniref:Thymidylate kinase n=1 Tax=Dendrosporobacter quercicolus TaxID=146817 RepID=A0A1G9QMM1_9FIRM|nr:deoxynucleoside kinase [Dendrosporobacter quercicolus]NSL48300.1 deoxynucleoside kinase [Dendrosporobacter quercicolus DSM 1736]SDM12254.1 dTMP kinase [Dendrosporobacter quercicolus]
MTGKLIIIEAGDGCGKATQTEKLAARLQSEGENVRRIEFPDYQSPSSALIKMYLNGAFGHQPQAVNPYAASSFYAVDRYASFKRDWEKFYQQGGIVICDRYTTSNMVHQAVKIPAPDEREAYLNWLWDFEFVKFGLPVPDAVIFLDMPPEYSLRLIQNRARQAGNAVDIHEANERYLADCYASYRQVAEKYHWRQVACVADGQLRSIDRIHADIYKIAAEVLVL